MTSVVFGRDAKIPHGSNYIREDTMPNLQTETPSPRSILRLPEVLARVGMKRSWLFAEVAAGRFPKPLKIGSASGWDSRAIDAYIESLVTSQTGEAAR